MTAQSAMHMNPDELRRHLRDPRSCRCCGQTPDVTKQYWNSEHTLWNWQVACKNPECPTQPFFNAYSWDDREMAVAKWNDEWGC